MASIISSSARNDSFTIDDCSPLTPSCIKALTDKIDEKRKFAASEIEKMTCEFSLTNNLTMINRLIIVLGRKFCLSNSPNARKGGLLGLAAVMVGFKNGCLSEPPEEIVEEVVRPILTCFLDSDTRVRYYACESLYNVTKVAGGSILPLFREIFDNMSKIVADIDMGVRGGAEVLDKVLRDIVVEQESLDAQIFLPKLEDYIYTKNPFTRMFIISWIRLLDSKIDMLSYLPQLLDGIFICLQDSTEAIRASTLNLLSEFLNKIVVCPTDRLNITSLTSTLLKHAQIDREDVQYTAIAWIRQFISLMDNQDLISFTPGILVAILPCLAIQLNHDGPGVGSSASSNNRYQYQNTQRFIPQSAGRGNICEIASLVNSQLLEQITIVLTERKNTLGLESNNMLAKTSTSLDLEPILKVLVKKLEKEDHPVVTLAVLDWLKRLKKAESDLVLSSTLQKKLFQSLLDILSARSDAVVKNALRVITEMFCFDQNISADDNKDNNQQVASGSDAPNSLVSGPGTGNVSTASDDNSAQLSAPKDDGTTSDLNKRKSPLRTNIPSSQQQQSKSIPKKVAIAPAASTSTTIASITAHNGSDASTPFSSQAHSNPNLLRFIQALCRMLRDKDTVFEERGTFIIINLCSMVRPDIVYRSFAEILREERTDLKFAYNMVQKLNQILLATQPLFVLRSRLSSANTTTIASIGGASSGGGGGGDGGDDSETTSLFLSLYYAWCHSPVAVLTLCLLTNNYKHASEIVKALSLADINIELLTQIDWVVQLIESPVFATLRMKLLDVNSNQYLLESLYGLLMILPQSEAFTKLGHRLDQVYKFMCAQPHFSHHSSSTNVTSAAATTKQSTTTNPPTLTATGGSSKTTSVETLMKHYFSIQNQRMNQDGP